ncbi:MAG: energy transducer TonB [Opitutae bacterium]|nr:energy transducer TonB [Opitutae bacterium]
MSRDLIIGILVSALLHAGFIFGLPKPSAEVKKHVEDKIDQLQMEMPPIEPDKEDKPEEQNDEPVENQIAPPSLVDLPTVVPVNAFVQQIQPPPPPGLQPSKGAVTIPVNRPGSNLGKGMKDLFDIANLDQAPSPKFQPQPNYPFEMRRAGVSGEVTVAFIVGSSGAVVEAYAVKSTQREFEAPAVQAVLKWQFRPGRKNGRAVNTRMQVPIVFNLNDE